MELNRVMLGCRWQEMGKERLEEAAKEGEWEEGEGTGKDLKEERGVEKEEEDWIVAEWEEGSNE